MIRAVVGTFVLAVSAAYAPPIFANACGNEGSAPQVFAVEAVGPKTLDASGHAPFAWDRFNARLTREFIHYVSGGALELELITDRCTVISGVTVGSHVLTTFDTYGYGYHPSPSNPQPSDPGQYGHRVEIHFPRQADGGTDLVKVTVRREDSSLTTEHAFSLVHVATIEASDVDVPFGFSTTEVHNMFAGALFTKFNGAQNSFMSNGRRLYDYQPSKLGVSVTTGGVSFSFKFKAEVNNWCDPTINASGRFKLQADARGIVVDWVNGPEASPIWPFPCSAVPVPEAWQFLKSLVGVDSGDPADTIRTTIEQAVFDRVNDIGQAQLLLTGSIARNNELLLTMNLQAPSLGIDVPYDPFDLPRTPTLFPPGEPLGFFASGIGMSDAAFGANPATSLVSGAMGVPLAGTTDFANPRVVDRFATMAPNAGPAGRLMVRDVPEFTIYPKTYQYDHGCSLTTAGGFGPPGDPSLRFGVNDSVTDAARLRELRAGGYSLRVLFLRDAPGFILDNQRPCIKKNTGPVNY